MPGRHIRRALLKISAVMDGKPRRARAPQPTTAHVAETREPAPAKVSLRHAVRYDLDEVFGGKRPLSVQEQNVMQLMAAGEGNAEIAGRFQRSQRTIETHVTHIFQKLNVSDRNAAIALYHEWETAGLKRQIKEL